MSETYLGEPRFVVTSVSGFSETHGRSATEAWCTKYQVLDRPYCYELVIETRSRKTAERIAAEMNAGDLRAAARQERGRELERVRDALYRKAKR